jgi:putative ATP-binding cassette transporter
VVVREIVDATAKLTSITAGYGWISIVAPIVIASPAYFSGRLSFGELMVVVGGFSQVNQSLRWYVDNFALLADWRAVLLRVIKFREALFASEIRRELARISQCAPMARITNGGRFHPDNCRLVW